MNLKLKLSGIGLMLLFAFTSCSNTGNETATEQTNKTEDKTGTEQTPQPATANLAPNAVFTNVKGESVSIESLKGKVVFLNFWATWCPPCKAELPSIQQLKKQYKTDDPIEFLFVDVNEPIQQARDYMKNNQYDLDVFVPDGMIPSEFLGQAIPTTVIIDKSGVIVSRVEGSRDYSAPDIKTFIDGLLGS